MIPCILKLVFGIKQNSAHAVGKARHRENLGKVVDEDLTTKGSRSGDLVFLCQFEEDARRINLRCIVSHQAARGEKSPRRRVQIVLRSQYRMLGLVADDEELMAGCARRHDKIRK